MRIQEVRQLTNFEVGTKVEFTIIVDSGRGMNVYGKAFGIVTKVNPTTLIIKTKEGLFKEKREDVCLYVDPFVGLEL